MAWSRYPKTPAERTVPAEPAYERLSGRFIDGALEQRFLAATEKNFRRRDRYVVILIFLLELFLIATDLRVFTDYPDVGALRLGVRVLYMASLVAIVLHLFARSRGLLGNLEHLFLLFSMLLHNGIIATYHHPAIEAHLPQGFQLAVYVFTITAYYTFLSPRLCGVLLVTIFLAWQYILFSLLLSKPDVGMVYAPFLLFSLIAFSHYTAVTLARQHRKVWLGQEQARQLQLRAEENQQFRTRLLELVGHDLHQPLGALRYCLTALRLETAVLEENMAKRIGKIASQIDQINQQVGSLLDKALELAQLDNNAVQARVRLQKVGGWINELQERFSVQAEKAGIALHIHGSRCSLRHDPALMSAVLRNLVGNALAYHTCHTPRPRVVVVLRQHLGGRIDVYDNGGGLTDGSLQHDRTTDNSTHPHRHGLGLMIARQLSDKQGWDLEIINDPGRGVHIRLSSRLPYLHSSDHVAPVWGGAAFTALR